LFNDWWAFEQLPNHLEAKAFYSYDIWCEDNKANLSEVEAYWAWRVELVKALKEGAAILAARVSEEGGGNKGDSSVMDVA
jgi:hypothetical protein